VVKNLGLVQRAKNRSRAAKAKAKLDLQAPVPLWKQAVTRTQLFHPVQSVAAYGFRPNRKALIEKWPQQDASGAWSK